MYNSFNIDQDLQRDNLQPTKGEYDYKVKQQAQRFHTELFDIAARISQSLIGDMERAGMHSVGDTLLTALAKLELLKESL